MVVAVIIAGGSGHRLGQDIPKQFINVFDKPILMYTLDVFQKHSLVDAIEVVCLNGWQDVVWAFSKQNGITKLQWVVSGGMTGQESIRNGVFHLQGILKEKDIVIIHDGVRPMIDERVITNVIHVAEHNGNAVTSMPYNEQIFVKNPDDVDATRQYIPRKTLRRVSTPQAYQFGLVNAAYQEAFEKQIGIQGSSYTNTMMVDLGYTLFFAEGSDRNIKITTIDDLELLKAYLRSMQV